jgi:hypothetical protein
MPDAPDRRDSKPPLNCCFRGGCRVGDTGSNQLPLRCEAGPAMLARGHPVGFALALRPGLSMDGFSAHHRSYSVGYSARGFRVHGRATDPITNTRARRCLVGLVPPAALVECVDGAMLALPVQGKVKPCGRERRSGSASWPKRPAPRRRRCGSMSGKASCLWPSAPRPDIATTRPRPSGDSTSSAAGRPPDSPWPRSDRSSTSVTAKTPLWTRPRPAGPSAHRPGRPDRTADGAPGDHRPPQGRGREGRTGDLPSRPGLPLPVNHAANHQ